MLACETQVAVRIVLKDYRAVFLSQFVSALALFKRSGKTCWVLEIADQVDQLDFACFQDFFQFIEVDAVIFEGDAS